MPMPTFMQNSLRFIPADSARMGYYMRNMIGLAKELPDRSFVVVAYSDYDENHDSVLSMKRAKLLCKMLTDSGVAANRLKPVCPKFYPATVYDDPDFPDGTLLTDEYVKTLSGKKREKADACNRRVYFNIYYPKK